MALLIDSDVLIEVSRGRDLEIVERWYELIESGEPALCSPVNVAELWRGAKPGEYDSLEKLFSVLLCVPIDHHAGKTAGAFLQKYARSHAVEIGDALIAACAAVSGASLWTRNRKHYPMAELRFY